MIAAAARHALLDFASAQDVPDAVRRVVRPLVAVEDRRAARAGTGIRKGLQTQFGIRLSNTPDADDQARAYVNDDGDMHHASSDAQLGQIAGPYAAGRSRHVPLEQVGRRTTQRRCLVLLCGPGDSERKSCSSIILPASLRKQWLCLRCSCASRRAPMLGCSLCMATADAARRRRSALGGLGR